MVGVDAAVEDGDADAFAHGGVPGAVSGAAGNVVAVAADLLDSPTLRSGVVGVVWRWGRGCRRKRRGGSGEDGAVGGESADRVGGAGRLSGSINSY